MPITLGQEFGGYAACVGRGAEDVAQAAAQLEELNIGATAVGTGLNAGEDFRQLVVATLARDTGLPLKPAANLFRVTQSMGDVVAYSGAMRRLAVELGKMASDLRLLSMGPRAGPGGDLAASRAARLVDHARQGEPVVPEMVNQVCFQVLGCDTTIAMAAEAGQLELNVMMPVIAWNALHASTILRQAMIALEDPNRGRHRCRSGSRARELLDRSTAAATALSAAHRLRSDRRDCQGGCPDRRVDPGSRARAGLADAEQADAILSVDAMTRGGVIGTKKAEKPRRARKVARARRS